MICNKKVFMMTYFIGVRTFWGRDLHILTLGTWFRKPVGWRRQKRKRPSDCNL